MPTASFVLTAVAVAVVLGGALTAYLWRIRRPQLEIAAGIKTLAAMRWREFSRFVIEALQAQGFEASRIEPKAESGQQADLLLQRGDQTWLLSCKQGANYRITATQVAELAKAVREASAGGGILATLGRIDAGARTHNHDIELLDGATLWPLIDPLLPPSLHEDLATRAKASTVRATGVAWLAALLLGFAAAMLLPPVTPPASSGPAASADLVRDEAPTAAPIAQPATTLPESTPIAAPPLSEDEQRDEVMNAISNLPGIDRALWSTKSTLLVYLQDEDASEREVASLCAELKRYDALRASRIQLQPVTGSTRPVRFMQCQAF